MNGQQLRELLYNWGIRTSNLSVDAMNELAKVITKKIRASRSRQTCRSARDAGIFS